MTPEDLRSGIFAELNAAGFRPAASLPLPDVNQPIRSAIEMASRLMALDALFTWVAFPEQNAATERVEGYIERNRLQAWLTPDELDILNTPRAEARENHVNNIGWRLENMWALAWALGFEPAPDLNASQITDDIIRSMIFDFLPGLDAEIATLVSKSSPRSAAEVIEMEYRFYCAHNAVRSAQLGGDTVPPDFDPIAHGGAVHERRHSLSWCVAPGVSWDDTDLST